jgi:hypothetical protein
MALPSSPEESMMGSANFPSRIPWNKGKLVGQQAPPKAKDTWAIRAHLQMDERPTVHHQVLAVALKKFPALQAVQVARPAQPGFRIADLGVASRSQVTLPPVMPMPPVRR